MLSYEPLSSPTPPPSVLMELTEVLSDRIPPQPHTHTHTLISHRIFPTHSASLAFHLLDINRSHECCDVTHQCTEGAPFVWIFLFSMSSTCFWNLPFNQNKFKLTLWLFLASLLLMVCMQHFPISLLDFWTMCEWTEAGVATPQSSHRRGQTGWSAQRPDHFVLFWQLPLKRE